MTACIIAAWIVLTALAAWWLLTRGTLDVPRETPGADPHAPDLADFRRAFSRWDHGGRPGA